MSDIAATVVDLAVYRAARTRQAEWPLVPRLREPRVLTPRQAAHRERMLRHLLSVRPAAIFSPPSARRAPA